MDHPYKVLGVKREVSQDEITRAYPKLAKRFHPDFNPGKPEADARFKDAAAGYELLRYPERRRATIASRSTCRSPSVTREDAHYRDFAEGRQPGRGDEGAFRVHDMSDLFADLFGDIRGARDDRLPSSCAAATFRTSISSRPSTARRGAGRQDTRRHRAAPAPRTGRCCTSWTRVSRG